MKTSSAAVLIIEPHPLMRASLRAAIEAESDLSVVEPTPGSANAFALMISSQYDLLFLSRKPDIILLSIGNPGLEDLQAMDRLRQKWKSTPILALTRDEVPGQEQAALAHGARAVLTKSASRSEILQTLRAIR